MIMQSPFKHRHNDNFSYVRKLNTQQPIDTGIKKNLDIILFKHHDDLQPHLLNHLKPETRLPVL